MRILIANSPLMYRETLALAIHHHNPDFEVAMAEPAFLVGEAERFEPHTLIRDDDGVQTGAPEGVVCWVGIIIDDHLKARVSVYGRVTAIHEVRLEEVLAALDATDKILLQNGIR